MLDVLVLDSFAITRHGNFHRASNFPDGQSALNLPGLPLLAPPGQPNALVLFCFDETPRPNSFSFNICSGANRPIIK